MGCQGIPTAVWRRLRSDLRICREIYGIQNALRPRRLL